MHVKATHLLCNPVRIAMLGVTEYKSAICQSLNNILRKINQPGSNKLGCRQLTNLRRSLHIGHPQGWSWLLLFIHTVHVGLLVYFCPCPPSYHDVFTTWLYVTMTERGHTELVSWEIMWINLPTHLMYVAPDWLKFYSSRFAVLTPILTSPGHCLLHQTKAVRFHESRDWCTYHYPVHIHIQVVDEE